MTLRSASTSSASSAGLDTTSHSSSAPIVEVDRRHPHQEGGRLLRRVRVELAADRVDGGVDLVAASPGRALEQQVLEEVARPGQVLGLVPTAGADPRGQRHRVRFGDRVGDDSDPGAGGRPTDSIVDARDRGVSAFVGQGACLNDAEGDAGDHVPLDLHDHARGSPRPRDRGHRGAPAPSRRTESLKFTC